MRLTPHFDSAEFRSHDGASTPGRQLHWLRRLCVDYLEPLRSEFGPVTILSGYRSATRNAQVGGARSSYHMRLRGRAGAAADVRCARGNPADWYRFLDQMGAPGLARYSWGVHVDNRRGRARW
jgi:uncharacterized protein YcbK (DUF882 family)